MMLPLLEKPSSDVNKPQYCGRILCVSLTILLLVTISILSYFNFGASSPSLNNTTNPTRSLFKKKGTKLNDGIIPSDPSKASTYYKASGLDDLIETMPNLDESSCASSTTNCGFKQYSGYLLANNNAEIHYWFIEADTNDDPTTLPLFFWTNGGPGCSGMDGLLTEHGPWRVLNNLDIEYNPYAWNTEINIVYLEQPLGVGFSTCDDDNIVAGDQNAANDMDAAIRNFLTKFPQYADNQIYLSSESWGGHYVPMTTYTILRNNDEGQTPEINLAGFLLGNPYTDFYENTYGFVGDIYGHGLMINNDWEDWVSSCWNNEYNIDYDQLCSAIYVRAYMSSWNANVYALDWPQCIDDEDWTKKHTLNNKNYKYQHDAHIHHHAKKFMKRVIDYENYDELNMRISKDELITIYDQLNENKLHENTNLVKKYTSNSNNNKLKANTYTTMSDSYLPCIEYNMADWLNLAEVQDALHVKPTAWEMCSDPVWDAWPDSDYDAFIQEYYTEIVDNYSVDKSLKLCVYSGDDDSVCGLQGTQYWLDRWDGFGANIDQQWVPWEDDDLELGGYYTQYISTNDQKLALHFITARTAGHMVPTTQPSRALSILKKFLYEFESA